MRRSFHQYVVEAKIIDQLRFLPDPIMRSDDHYLPSTVQTLTTEIYRPSLKGENLAKPLPSSPSVQHALNTNIVVQCDECDMWRLVFSKRSYLLPYVQLYGLCWMMCHIIVGHH